jgi:Domain of unknown function (DUF1906)
MAFGLDYSDLVQVSVPKQMGAEFVCRYVGYFSGYDINNIAKQQGKCLYPDEAAALMYAGIGVVSVYEWYNARPALANNNGIAANAYSSGVWDAHTAGIIHTACGGPQNAPIYFCVDYDSNGEEVVDYFKGVAYVLGVDRVGVYGGYSCVKYLLDQGLVTWTWQTYAWSAGQWDQRANIRQYNNGALLLDGSTGDYDESMTIRYGNWLDYIGGDTVFTNERCVAVWNSTGFGSDDVKRTSGIFSYWQAEWRDKKNYMGAPSSHEYSFPAPDGSVGVARNFGSNTVGWSEKTGAYIVD